MKKLVIYLLLATAGLMSCLGLQAQEQGKHEFSIWGAGGLSSLKYKPIIGSKKNGLGGQLGLGYTYFLNKQWGVGSGLEFSIYNAKLKTENLADNYLTKDINGTEFEFRTKVSNYEEKQNALFLNIPLMLYYQTKGHSRFYGAVGGKVGIPVSGKYKVKGAEYRNSGYYAHEEYEYTTQEFLGFGKFSDQNIKEDLDLKVAYMLSAELGMKWSIGESYSLYTGAYVDYGLNDVNKYKNRDHLITYNTENPKDFINNSIMTSRYNEKAMVNKVHPLAAGIKVRFAFGKKESKPQPVKYVELVVNPTPPIVKEQEDLAEAERKRLEELRRGLEEVERLRKQREEEVRDKALRQVLAVVQKDPLTDYIIDQTSLSEVAKKELDIKITILKKHPEWTVECVGHTCDQGSKQVNNHVGLQRAQQVKDYLVEHGIVEQRIQVVSKGATEPIADNNKESNRRKNRRVELKVNRKVRF